MGKHVVRSNWTCVYVFESVVVEACPVRGRLPTMLWNLAFQITPKALRYGLVFL